MDYPGQNRQSSTSQKIISPTLNLPKGGGAMKGIGETFQPNGFSGTGNYAIPIPVTPARGFDPLWIDDYSEITSILKEIESRFLRTTILISGSAEEYGSFGEEGAIEFLHDLSKSLSHNSCKILTGFGWGVGSAVINGVLENMENERNQNLDNYLIMRPFPQFETKGKKPKELWSDYRKKFIPLAGIGIFVFGNKKNKITGKLEEASGMIEEFEIAISNGLMVIPVGATGYAAKILWEKVMGDFDNFFPNHSSLISEFRKLGDSSVPNKELIKTITFIINSLNS